MGLVRLFLALIVAYDHWRASVLRPRGLDTIGGLDQLGFNAGYAVMFFYVISGFLITYTLSRNYAPDAASTLRFYRNRFVRIFSLYWPLIVIAFIILPGAWTGFVRADAIDVFTKVFILGQDWRVAFASYPQQHYDATVIAPSWTLGAELSFYLLAPLLMRSWKTAAVILVVSCALRAFLIHRYGDLVVTPILTYEFALSTFCFFMLGHLICRAAQTYSVLLKPATALVLMPLSIGTMALGDYVGFDSRRFWISIILFTLALPALFEATKRSSRLNYIGDLSYPTYLVHMLVLPVIGIKIFEATSFLGPRGTALAFMVVAVLFAAVTHHLFERPASILRDRPQRVRLAIP